MFLHALHGAECAAAAAADIARRVRSIPRSNAHSFHDIGRQQSGAAISRQKSGVK